MGLAHERFADEAGVESGGAEPKQIVGGADAAFGDADGAGRKLIDEVERSLEPDFEGAKIAVVHAVAVASEIADADQLVGSVDFAEDLELERVGGGSEAGEVGVGQRGRDEQDGVGMVGASFDDLIVVDDEVLAEAGDLCGCGGNGEVGEAALEEGRVRQNRERGSSGIFEVGGERQGIEVSPDQALRRGALLEFGDDGRGSAVDIAKRPGETAGCVLLRLQLKIAQGDVLAAQGHVGAGLSKDAVEMRDGFAPDSSIAISYRGVAAEQTGGERAHPHPFAA